MNCIFLIPLLILLCIFIAAVKKVSTRRFFFLRPFFNEENIPDDFENYKKGPLAMAMLEIVAMAGGIYLALITMVNFLKLSIPDLVTVCGVSFDLLAAVSLMLSVLEPFIGDLLAKYYLNK